jgi:glycolate oxidase iron-sulfur subunit
LRALRLLHGDVPTYQLLGDELDGPRGTNLPDQGRPRRQGRHREDAAASRSCLTCRSCETTCPSGVKYGRLLDIGRHIVDERVPRPAAEQALRWTLRRALTAKPLFGGAVMLGRMAKFALPKDIAGKLPSAPPAGYWPPPRHSRKMLALSDASSRR